ncbi:zinc finger domain-containing protein [Ordospora colligata]|uniref:Pre-mRNA-splicing factor CWC24 n=1 Tax=Ordospora colligata OC4 TaxID=1354746 RepID=A0A0B2UK68_9MICR|nr:zinc finger domain-containing protein [Ordospora colligata OC4]KHN69442.1 zinc finger domain-containing protein [Ordospora colligata OC4]TBU15186.1 zinc finger domain-containing protein [Ordospora colligata]TBU15257.1 zinc finger domain-containing protein [Ordospora colligata]TBU18439.1 zinc finger domain-containing protein [Ordospora colligata]
MVNDEEVVDMHKMICKPFKETGYCGYGESCKYLHIRDSEIEMKHSGVDVDVCGICKERFDEKVVAECGHCFCSMCVMKKYRYEDVCVVCGRRTYGRFWIG